MKTLRTVEMYTKDDQETYYYETESKVLYSLETITSLHQEYLANNEYATETDLSNFIEMATDKNGTLEIVYLNNDLEKDYINEMLKDGIELEECISCIDNENCFNK